MDGADEPQPDGASTSSDCTRPSIAGVVLNYNYGDFVLDAVASLQARSIPFTEIVVVDDGSTDESRESLRRHAPDVAVLEKANGGKLSAAIAALAHVSSDYV